MNTCTVHADSITPQPWRNGGGRTRELLAWPSAAGWRLRISVADIEADGPFSAFDGVQRWFAVISGAGVVLRFFKREQALVVGDAPLCFDGALAPGCRLIDGPTRDLNLMARGGSAKMQVIAAGVTWTSVAAQRGLFCAVDGTWRGPDGASAELPANSLLWLPEPTSGDFSFEPLQPSASDTAPAGPLGWWLEYAAP